jgi:hypothetical protein
VGPKVKNNCFLNITNEEEPSGSESKQLPDTDSDPIDFAKNFKAALLAAQPKQAKSTVAKTNFPFTFVKSRTDGKYQI